MILYRFLFAVSTTFTLRIFRFLLSIFFIIPYNDWLFNN